MNLSSTLILAGHKLPLKQLLKTSMAMGHTSDKIIRRKEREKVRERKRTRKGEAKMKQGGMGEGREEYTWDQDERKRTVVTVSGKINTLLLHSCYVNCFDNLMETFVKTCMCDGKNCTACLFLLSQTSWTALSRRLVLFKLLNPTHGQSRRLQSVNVSLAAFQHLALSKHPGLHPKNILMLITLPGNF